MTSRILLVEDDPDVQLIVADLLRGHGHQVDVAAGGEEALRTANEQQFDLMILDLMLPGINGFEVCRAVRERGFDGAILMLTARSQVDDRVEGLRTGADDYLTKPFDFQRTARTRERPAPASWEDSADPRSEVPVRRRHSRF